MSNSHICIKCGINYFDSEVDDYYCPECNEARKVIAKEVDAKLAGRTTKHVKSDLQIYDEICKARGSKFINIKDLGIKL